MTRLNATRSLACGVLMACLLAACAGAPPPTGMPPQLAPTLADAPAATMPARATGATPLPCYTLTELEAMGPETSASLPEFCLRGDDGGLTIIPQAQSVETIRTTLGDPARQVVFTGIGLVPNAPNSDLRAAVFRDARGSDYYVALAANKLVEFTAPTDGAPLGTGSVAESELRRAAEELVRRGLPSFPDLLPQLEDMSGVKGEFFFYRWEARDCMAWTMMPPLAQVGMTSSGEVFSYINTLFYCQ
jgi:hypothetical protein